MEMKEEDLTYNDIFIKHPEQSSLSIGEAYQTIEELLVEAETYFQ
ncbi:unnamed protein product, partial [Rotaria magnacalcarata]